MIYLPEVGSTLETILNNSSLDYDFAVATEGFHLDHTYDKRLHNNFIPVFISSMGGSYDAVKGLKRSTQNIQVAIYFPVRFKNDFFALVDYIENNFIAEIKDYGTLTGSCLSNISGIQFGEIIDLDLRKFREWSSDIYRMPMDIMEPYMSMVFQLYLTTNADTYMLGNSIKYNLSFDYNGVAYSEDLVWVQSGTGMSNSPIAQQLIDETNSFAKNVINITNYNKSIMVYVKNNAFWKVLINAYNNYQLNTLTNLILTKTYTNINNLEFAYNQVVLSVNENVSLGDLITFTITFGDKK